MMKLGFVSAILPELSLEEVLSLAKQQGYDCVELMCWPVGKATRRYAGVTHLDVTEFDDAAAARTKALADQYGITISALGYYPNALSPDDAEAQQGVEHIKKVIRAAGILGVGMNSFVGRDWTKSIDDNWPRFQDVWGSIIEVAEACQVHVGIENCPMFFTMDEWPGGKNLAFCPSIWRRMFETIPSTYFGLNYDPSHMIWQQMDYLRPLREFSNRLFHVHAKDVRMDIERLNDVGIMATPAEYHTPKLPGMGDVDWGKFFSILTDVGYHGPVCVEVEDRAYERSIADRKLSLVQSHTFLRNYLPAT